MLVGLTIVTNAGCSKPKPPLPRSEAPNDVIVIVGDEQITSKQFSAEVNRRQVAGDTKSQKALLDEMVNTLVLGQEARRRGYDHDPQVVAAVDNLLAQRMREEFRAQAKAGSQEIEAYYKAHAAEFTTPTAVRCAIIFTAAPVQAPVEARAEKRAAIDTIRQRAAGLSPNTVGFGTLAAQFSDDQETKLRGGDMGVFVEGHANARWENSVIDAAFALHNPAQLSDVITTERGYYLVKLTARHDASPRPLNLVRSQVEKQLIDEKERQFTAELVKSASDRQSIIVGVLSGNGKNCTLRIGGQRSQGAELSRAELGAAAPQVIPGEIDVLPAEW